MAYLNEAHTHFKFNLQDTPTPLAPQDVRPVTGTVNHECAPGIFSESPPPDRSQKDSGFTELSLNLKTVNDDVKKASELIKDTISMVFFL